VNEYPAGSASIVELVDILDSTSTTGAGKTGLAYNTASLTCYYKRSSGTASVAVTLVDITTLGTYVSGGFKEIDATHMPGAYEFHPPNAAFNSGAKYVTFYFVGATGMVRRPIKYRILGGLDPDNATNLGIPALVADPMAAVPASYLSTQIGGMVGAIKTQSDKLQFDGSNNVKALVNLYASGQDPGAIVWGAATSYNTVGTMGGLQNSDRRRIRHRPGARLPDVERGARHVQHGHDVRRQGQHAGQCIRPVDGHGRHGLHQFAGRLLPERDQGPVGQVDVRRVQQYPVSCVYV
jgi:hypothetical protein